MTSTTAALVLPEIKFPLPIQFISGIVASAYYVKSLVAMLVFFIVPSLVPNAPAKAPARAQRRVSKFRTRHGLSVTISVESSQSTGPALVDQKIKVAKRVKVQETGSGEKNEKIHRPILSGARKMSTAFVKMSAPIEAAAHKSWKPLARRMTVPAIKVRDVAGVVAQSVQAVPRRRLSLDSALPFLRKPKAADDGQG